MRCLNHAQLIRVKLSAMYKAILSGLEVELEFDICWP